MAFGHNKGEKFQIPNTQQWCVMNGIANIHLLYSIYDIDHPAHILTYIKDVCEVS